MLEVQIDLRAGGKPGAGSGKPWGAEGLEEDEEQKARPSVNARNGWLEGFFIDGLP